MDLSVTYQIAVLLQAFSKHSTSQLNYGSRGIFALHARVIIASIQGLLKYVF